ncbi:armadillo-type protein [Rhodocollybia butyracea]|uniref:Armadillo-type protein n=1 Tax=Rhodocollybia butyracea TaxID=206335 RepID=A0A9P5PX67_9AGAR|nr:armadillo-type protein [Rhodocollybia butyracea]
MNFTPFISSGASSRLHYVLVRKVESAPSPQVVDDIVVAEMKSLIQKLADNVQLFQTTCKEYLIVLLYCITASTAPLPTLDSVLPLAVNLAEAGHSVSEKLPGYLFCAQVLPACHELQLMLVNTLRKDLESSRLPKICLALDHLIQCPSEDVIPAIESRLRDLLAHNSPQVRRRALLASKALSFHDSDLMNRIQQDVTRRVRDLEPDVCNAALIVAYRLCEINDSARAQIQDAVNELLYATWSKNYDRRERRIIIRLLPSLRTLGLTDSNLPLLNEIIQHAFLRKDYVLLRSAFLSLPGALSISSTGSPISHIRSLLTSREPNENYLFLTCLECLDPKTWAGTIAEFPAVLEQWEVEHIMRYLDSSDSGLRKKVMNILNMVDKNITSSYYMGTLKNLPNVPVDLKPESALRLLQVLEVQAGSDPEHYAQGVMNLLGEIDPLNPSGRVLEHAIEMVLTHIRQSSKDFRREASAHMLKSLSEINRQLGPTTMVIMAALACESSGQDSSSSSPCGIMKGISSRIAFCPSPVQDACLLAMVRVAADCEDVQQETVATVSKLKEASGRHIKRRCEQFLQLCSNKEALAKVVHSARSSTLPDFLEALQKYQFSDNMHPDFDQGSPNQSSKSNSNSLSVNKLRYAAYDAPIPTPRLQGRRPSNSDYSSDLSGHGSPHSIDSPVLVAGGELTLAASTAEFESEMSATIIQSWTIHEYLFRIEVQQPTRNDLIAFDLPFVSDLPGAHKSQLLDGSLYEPSFESTWEALEERARGWYEGSIDQLLRSMQVMDPPNVNMSVIESSLPPFPGELKVMIKFKPHISQSSCVALRLKENEDESCLWTLRGRGLLFATVKNILKD